MEVLGKQAAFSVWKTSRRAVVGSTLAHFIAAGVCAAEPKAAPSDLPAPKEKTEKTNLAPREELIDLPAVGGERSISPVEGRTAKPASGPVSLWQLPPPKLVSEAPNIAESNPQLERLLNSQFDLSRFAPVLPQGDPGARATLYGAMTKDESMLDGFGGIPTPFPTVTPALGDSATDKKFRVGPFTLRSACNVGVGYDYISQDGFLNSGTGSQSSGGKNEQSDFGPTAGATFNFLLGEPATGHVLALKYGVQFGSNGANEGGNGTDSSQLVNQQLSMVGTLAFNKLTLGMGISYLGLSGPSRDSGGNTERQLLTVSLTSSYAITAKTSIDWDLNVPIRQTNGGLDSNTLSSTVFANHLLNPKLETGLGVTVGTEEVHGTASQALQPGNTMVQDGNAQIFKQLLSRVAFRPSPRLSIAGTLGVEFRSAGDKQVVNPIFSFGGQWLLREGTSVGISAAQTVKSSESTANADYLSTSLTIGVSQRLGNRVSLDLSVGYQRATYGSTQSGISLDRVDNLCTGQIGLNWNVNRRWSSSLFYVYARNQSLTNGFQSSRAQFQMSYIF